MARSCATPTANPRARFKESADDLVAKFTPKPTREERLAALRLGMHEANRFGLVRVHSAGRRFRMTSTFTTNCGRNGELTSASTSPTFSIRPNSNPDEIEKIEQARRTYHDDWISGGVVKTMLDGVIEAHTAAMLEPYSDDPTQDRQTVLGPGEIQASRRGTRPTRVTDLHACHRRQSGAAGARRLRGRAETNHTHDHASPHRAHRDHQRAGYSALRQTGSHCQLPAAACLSG